MGACSGTACREKLAAPVSASTDSAIFGAGVAVRFQRVVNDMRLGSRNNKAAVAQSVPISELETNT
jgi:hypothetical protein